MVPGRAHEFLQRHAESHALLPVVVWAEFAEGFGQVSDPTFLSVVDSFEILPITGQVAAIYAGITRQLRAAGNLMGANDLWIASIALERNHPLVTSNLEHFTRVPGLEVRSY